MYKSEFNTGDRHIHVACRCEGPALGAKGGLWYKSNMTGAMESKDMCLECLPPLHIVECEREVSSE
jgi:hypothetical protein